MTSEELKTALDRIGITPRDLSLIADVTERQVRGWRTGTSPVPRLVEMTLLAMNSGEISLDFVTNFVEGKLRSQV
jgi:hypothetical protein